MARISVDADGVLAQFGRGFLQMANTIWPGRLDVNIQPKQWEDFQGLSKAEINQVWDKINTTNNFWLSLDAYTDNVAALSRFLISTKGHDVWIVTSRTPGSGLTVSKQTMIWLFSCGVFQGVNYLGVIPSEHPSGKRAIYKAMAMGFSVDDKAETVEGCQTLEGHTAFLLDRPWNQGAKVKHRISNLEEYFKHIKGT